MAKRYSIQELRAFVGRADTEEKVETARAFIARLPYLTKSERQELDERLEEALWPNDAEDPWFNDCGGADDYDYSPSAPWNAPGMKVSDFITGVSWR